MKKIIFLICCISACFFAAAQDLHFSQYTEMPLLRNPALAGNFNGQVRALLAYRSQWQAVSVPYKTMAVGGEFKLLGGQCIDESFTLTGGVQYLRDEAGDSKLVRNMYLLSATGRKQLTHNLYASAGFLGGPVTSNFNFSALKWGDQYVNGQYLPTNPTNQFIPSNGRNYFDLGWGISLGSNDDYYQWYVGYGNYHIHRPKVGFGSSESDLSKLPMRQTINAGLGIRRNETEVLNVYADYMWQGGQNQFFAGTMYRWEWDNETGSDGDGKSFAAGIFYRLNDAIVPTVNVQLKQFSAGLSYDVNVSKLRSASQFRGGFELTLKFRGVIFGDKITCGKMGCF
jgi:type IX secretion system PorP/SprF family membrane protein